MTLDTRVYIHSPISYRDVFVKCNQLIGSHEGIKFTDKEVKYPEGERRLLYNHPGQGLPALLDVSYRNDGPLYTGTSHWDDCGDDCTYEPHFIPRWLEVSFDTAYGYIGENGERCGDLHARLVTELGVWLDERGVIWSWKNEFTGKVHRGYEGLTDLCSEGSNACSWFDADVAPALQAQELLSYLKSREFQD